MNDYIDRQAAIEALGERPVVWDEWTDEYTLGQRKQYDYDKLAIEALPSAEVELVKHGRWIPVSERLPKQGQEVICQCRASIIKVLKLDADGDWYQDASHCYMRGFVIAWMPLPEPYAEEGEEDE